MPQNNSKAQREYRRTQAEARQAERDKRTPREQVTLLESRPGFANKETARLLVQANTPKDTPSARLPKRVRTPKPKA